MEFLPLLHSDLEELRALQPADWADIIAPTQRNVESAHSDVYKAVEDGMMVGTGAVMYNGKTAWLATIIVHPGHRNKGIGKQITQWLIDSVDRTRYATLLLDATSFGYPVYRSLGFETITHHAHFEAIKPYITETALPNIKSFESIYQDQILGLDMAATGEDRATTLLTKIDSAIVYVDDNGQVQGFYMPELMKGLLIAANPIAGTELMKLRLQRSPHCMFPIENTAATQFLLDNGYMQTHTSTRMRLGPMVDWNPLFIYNVASGAVG